MGDLLYLPRSSEGLTCLTSRVFNGKPQMYDVSLSVNTRQNLNPSLDLGKYSKSAVQTRPGVSSFSNSLWFPLTIIFLLDVFNLQCRHLSITCFASLPDPLVHENNRCHVSTNNLL